MEKAAPAKGAGEKPGTFWVISGLAAFVVLGVLLGWLLDSASSLAGQRPDRTTQVLMFLACVLPAAALVAFRRWGCREKTAGRGKQRSHD